MNKSKPRQLKIYPKFQQTSRWNSKFVPEIRLCGKWLEDMGFDYRDRITVRLEDGKLIIEPEGELRKNPQLEITFPDRSAKPTFGKPNPSKG